MNLKSVKDIDVAIDYDTGGIWVGGKHLQGAVTVGDIVAAAKKHNKGEVDGTQV